MGPGDIVLVEGGFKKWVDKNKVVNGSFDMTTISVLKNLSLTEMQQFLADHQPHSNASAGPAGSAVFGVYVSSTSQQR